jgi:hypothetical protein
MSPLTTKAQILKFESNILRSTARRYKKSRKTQEGHLEEGKPQKARKAAKVRKMARKSKENLKINTETQKSKKMSKLAQKLKINTPSEINSPKHSQCKLSPLDSHLSYFFSQPPS